MLLLKARKLLLMKIALKVSLGGKNWLSSIRSRRRAIRMTVMATTVRNLRRVCDNPGLKKKDDKFTVEIQWNPS